MTSSFSNLVLGGLALLHGQQLATVLPDICREVSSQLTPLFSAAQQIAAWCDDRIVVLASGMQALACEASLKTVEMTAGRVMAMPETFLGLRHGPISFLREDTPIICFASADANKRRYEQDLIDDLKQRSLGRIIFIGNSESANDALVRPQRLGLTGYAAHALRSGVRSIALLPPERARRHRSR